MTAIILAQNKHTDAWTAEIVSSVRKKVELI